MNIILKILTFSACIISVLLLPACKQKKADGGLSTNTLKAVEVKAVVVVPRVLENKILTTGTILANEEVEIRAEVPGRITGIYFQEGSYVKKGDLLVQINDSELQAQLKKLTLDEKLANDDVFRKEKLMEMKAVSQEELDIARNQLGVIQADIELVRSQLDKTKIYAPFNGRIGLRYVSSGGFISSTTLIARLQQTDPVKIELNVPEKYVSSITAGLEIQFTISGSDSNFTGTVYAVEPRIDPSTRAFTARARCMNTGNILMPGAFARISIILDKIPDALVIPSEALIPDLMGKKVLLARNGRIKTVYVNTGIHTENDVQVTSGINPMDTVIISGLLQLREGMSVRPRITEIR